MRDPKAILPFLFSPLALRYATVTAERLDQIFAEIALT